MHILTLKKNVYKGGQEARECLPFKKTLKLMNESKVVFVWLTVIQIP